MRRVQMPRFARRGARRRASALALALLLLALLAGLGEPGIARGQDAAANSPATEFGLQNPIVRENRQPGSREWQRPHLGASSQPSASPDRTQGEGEDSAPGIDAWTPPLISGYADRVSVEPGSTIRFHISTSAPIYDLTVSRMGWYDGQGGRPVHKAFGLPGLEQPVPAPDPETGLVEASWRPTYSLTIPRDWISGVYLARLLATNDEQDVGYILFVVRDDEQVADFVYRVPVNTYQAYNNWGGKSLYPQNSVGERAVKVSFDRPYSQWDGAGRFFEWDFPMIRWLEREGYNVTYITDVDAHSSTSYLRGRRALLSVGHDEYWSMEMRDMLEAARDSNISLAFFSGNVGYWQVRYEPSSHGVPNRVLVGYKNMAKDPLGQQDDPRTTSSWRSEVVGRPENALLGIQWEGVIGFFTSFPYVVKAADHWIFEGTEAKPGQAWNTIVGYEYDRVHDNGKTPPGLVVLSESPVVDVHGHSSIAHSTYYRKGGMVFAAGTVHWAWGLDDARASGYVDPRIQRMTANILKAFRQGGPPLAARKASNEDSFPWLLGTAPLVALLAAGSIWYVRRSRDPDPDEYAD